MILSPSHDGPEAEPAPSAPILDLRGLVITVPGADGERQAVVDRVSFSVGPGERVALVGESGSGKSLSALAIFGLVPEPAQATAEHISIAGIDLDTASAASAAAWRRLRGSQIGLALQEPGTALNPVFSIGFQLVETIRSHHSCSRRRARQDACRLLAALDLSEPEQLLRAYPHQLSGGQQQRVMLALALAGRPRLVIADEPTTALDVTTQAQVLALLRRICSDQGMALLLISHDLAVVACTVDRVLVMLTGEIVEEAPVAELFAKPHHPYTRMLLDAARGSATAHIGQAGATTGSPEQPGSDGCRFAARCPVAEPRCGEQHPSLRRLTAQHRTRCLLEEDP